MMWKIQPHWLAHLNDIKTDVCDKDIILLIHSHLVLQQQKVL